MNASLPGPGDVLAGRYAIERELGRGGYSIVYLARDRTLDVPVALKLLFPPPAVLDEARERMRREANAVRTLAHPNVVALHDFVEQEGRHFLVMEWVDGPDLAALVAASGPLTPARAASLARDIAEALAAGHEHGIIHRDVKPRNVLVDSDGKGRLTDFGSARIEGQTTMTHAGGIVGTLAYTAPEILAGGRGDGRSDVYALGLTLFFSMTGTLPRGVGPLGPTADPDGFRPTGTGTQVPAWLDDVVARATRANPRHRFATAQALAGALGDGESAGVSLTVGTGRCLVCGESVAEELGVCPACAATSEGAKGGTALVFLRSPASRTDRRHRIEDLEDLLGAAARPPDVAAAATGGRALLRAPVAVAARAVGALERDGYPAFATSTLGALRRIPRPFSVLVASGLVVGVTAGAMGSTLIGLSSPAMAILLWLAALERVRRPVLDVRPQPSALPAAAEAEAVAVLSTLPLGTARDLLSDLLRLARLLAAGDGFPHLDPDGSDLGTALRSGAALAKDLDRLDRALALLDASSTHAGTEASVRDTVAGAERARDRLVQALLSGLAALGRAHAHLADAPGAGAALREALTSLEQEAERHAAASAEVEALLARS